MTETDTNSIAPHESTISAAESTANQGKGGVLGWRLIVAALAISSGLVTLWNLAAGERSEYYASIAVSMSKNLSNFFFGAIDPAGTISLDKIPGSYWASAIFVKLFGFSTWSVNAPNAIATVAVVLVIAFSVKNLYGPRAGMIAGFLVAGVPIAIAVARSNQPESMFVLMLSLALWQALKAFKLTSRKHLIFAGAWIAAAFQMYMIVAWAVWPALILAWFFTEQKLGKKIIDLTIAGFTSLGLSLLWIFIVWLTPASNRPYVGGTYANSPWEMVFGYNALGRFSSDAGSASSASYRSFTPPFGGEAGIGRLFNTQLSGQVSWLIPATVVAIIALLVLREKRTTTIFLAGWFVTFGIMFSAVAGLHQFYVTAMVIPMVTLVAMAIEAARRAEQKIWLATVVAVTALWAVFVGLTYGGYLTALPYVQLAIAVATLFGLFASVKFLKTPFAKGLVTAGILGSLALTPAAWAVDTINNPSSINPAAGPSSLQMGGMGGGAGGKGGFDPGASGGPGAMGQPPTGGFGGPGGQPPMGGRDHGDSGHGGGWSPTGLTSTDTTQATDGNAAKAPSFGSGQTAANQALIAYLKANRGDSKYLVAVFGAQAAAPIITATGESVLPIGGFDGSDPAPTLEQFKKMVAAGEVKYVLSGGNGAVGGPGGGMSGSSSTTSISAEIQSWVTAHFIADTAYKGTGTLLVYSK
jgi:4-amino-4-deoxy-L-arabinose transferase-like glycosyltransferase